MNVSGLHVYPIKSTRGAAVSTAVVEKWGLRHDRRWMVVDHTGARVSAREDRRLFLVEATPAGSGALTISGPHLAPLTVSAGADDPQMPVRIGRSDLLATCPDAKADAWFSELLERAVRLVWLDDPTRRSVNPAIGRPEDHVSFADGYPLLLTTTASLRRLDDWILEEARFRGESVPEPLPMTRFRPNVVVDAAEPFAEDHWERVAIGEVTFRAAKGCDRCVMTTIDPQTLASGKEPIRTLARHRRWDGQVWFGVNLIPDGVGTISVNDPVTVGPHAPR